MTSLVKIVLFSALGIFVIGLVWFGIVLQRKHNTTVTQQTPSNTTAANSAASSSNPVTATTPSSTTAPTGRGATITPANQSVSPSKRVIKVTITRTVTIFEPVVTDSQAEAFAGVNPDGSTYAEAVAN